MLTPTKEHPLKRSLSLKREALSDLTARELSGVVGGIDEIPTVVNVCHVIQPTGLVQCFPATTR